MRLTRLPLLLLTLAPALAAAAEPAPPEDPRTLVQMPALQQALMREEMVDSLAALNEVLGHLAAGRLKEAGATAEQRLGLSTMGKHAARTGGRGPGRFMPEAMRGIGVGMHRAASEFAEVAAKGDRAAAYRALEPVTAACVACHVGYRLR